MNSHHNQQIDERRFDCEKKMWVENEETKPSKEKITIEITGKTTQIIICLEDEAIKLPLNKEIS